MISASEGVQRVFAIRCGAPMADTVDAIPGLYAEDVPPVGTVVPAADSYYEHVAGRFRFRAASTRAVAAAIAQTAAGYRVSAEPVYTAAAGPSARQ